MMARKINTTEQLVGNVTKRTGGQLMARFIEFNKCCDQKADR